MRARSVSIVVAKRRSRRARFDLAELAEGMAERRVAIARPPPARADETRHVRFIPPIQREDVSVVTDRANPTRTRFHPSGAPVAAGAVLLCQSHGCFYFPRWRSPCRPGLSRSQHTAHRGRTCLRSVACRRRSPRSPRQVLLQRASLARAPMETRCAGLLLRCCHAPPAAHPAHRRPVVSQDARLFSWRALRYAAGTASGAAAYARLEQTGRAAVGRESGARGARKGTHRRFLDARRTSQRAHRARPPRTPAAHAHRRRRRAQDAGAVGRRRSWSGP